MITDYAERRKDKRLYTRLSAQYTVLAPPSDSSLGGLTYDISCGGLRMRCNEFMPLHTRLKVSLYLGSSLWMMTFASVKWITKEPYNEQYQVGLEAESADEEYSDNVKGYIDYTSKYHANPRAYSAYKVG